MTTTLRITLWWKCKISNDAKDKTQWKDYEKTSLSGGHRKMSFTLTVHPTEHQCYDDTKETNFDTEHFICLAPCNIMKTESGVLNLWIYLPPQEIQRGYMGCMRCMSENLSCLPSHLMQILTQMIMFWLPNNYLQVNQDITDCFNG